MKSNKKLIELYNQAKGDNSYYNFDNFKENAKDYIKDIKKYKTICSMTVSKSGMTRHFNYDKYNMLLNICYNQKFSWDSVKVGGCGMDMHFYLQYTVCKDIMTSGEIEKYNINCKCSSGKIL